MVESESTVIFTKKMRNFTRDIHSISDALVNAKVAVAMSDDRVWAEGLLVFFEVFRYLEGAMDRLSHTLIKELDIPGMRRLPYFEADLSYYLGPEWRTDYVPRTSVRDYLEHLQQLERDSPHLLLAFIYHMYMGLLSGGQILLKKRALLRQIPFIRNETLDGLSIFSTDGSTPAKLKQQMVTAMNLVASKLDKETHHGLLVESRRVFELNNALVRSVKTAGPAFVSRLVKWTCFAAVLAVMVIYVRKWMT